MFVSACMQSGTRSIRSSWFELDRLYHCMKCIVCCKRHRVRSQLFEFLGGKGENNNRVHLGPNLAVSLIFHCLGYRATLVMETKSSRKRKLDYDEQAGAPVEAILKRRRTER